MKQKLNLLFVFIITFVSAYYNINNYVLADGTTPCQGDTIFNETFINGIPPTWTVLDIDSLIPNDTSAWTGAWQPVIKDLSAVVGNTSWYKPAGKSNDFLITPAIALSGAQPSCLSFRTRAEDDSWKDDYEVRISTTFPTETGMKANPALLIDTTSFAWSNITIDLSAYIGKIVYIGFWHNANDKSAIYLDDVMITEPDGYDLSVKTLDIGLRIDPNTYTVSGTIDNYGFQTVNTMKLNWNVNGGTVNTDNLTALNIAPYSTSSYSHTVKFNATTPGAYTLKVWASSLNGTNDQKPSNDTLTKMLTVKNGASAQKWVFVEEFTGAWCGACPDGHYVIDTIKTRYPTAIAVKIHTNDGMEISETKDLKDIYPTFYPAGLIDRIPFNASQGYLVAFHRQDWGSIVADRLNSSAPVVVDLVKQYNETTRELNVKITAKFIDFVVGDIRFLSYISESNVVGSGDQFDQRNFYNSVPGSPFYLKGDPILLYAHKDVVRALPLGAWGTNGTIPTTVNPNDTFSLSYNYTLASNFNVSDVRVVAAIYVHNSDIFQREILNSVISTIWTTDIPEPSAINSSLINSVYPNPAKGLASINFYLSELSHVSVDVYSILGEKVTTIKKAKFIEGEHFVYFDVTNVPAGVYFIAIKTEKESVIEKIVVVK